MLSLQFPYPPLIPTLSMSPALVFNRPSLDFFVATRLTLSSSSSPFSLARFPTPSRHTGGISSNSNRSSIIHHSQFRCTCAHAHSTEAEAEAEAEAETFTSVDRERLEREIKRERERERERERDEVQQQQLPSGLQKELLPKHVAVIMDGNSRWARSRGLRTSAGHEAGYRSLKEIVKLSCKWGIRALTVFAFSSENWLRPKTEIDFLLMLFETVLKENLTDFLRNGIRVCIIGDLSKLPKSLQKLAREVEESTRNNSRLDLVVAMSYSGRSDIVQACRRIAEKVKEGLLEPEEVTESVIAQELETNCVTKFTYPDLLIRTSGELRLSNFLLWQSAYTEFYFTEVHWPDFKEADYIEALSSFQRRQRRFGLRTV